MPRNVNVPNWPTDGQPLPGRPGARVRRGQRYPAGRLRRRVRRAPARCARRAAGRGGGRRRDDNDGWVRGASGQLGAGVRPRRAARGGARARQRPDRRRRDTRRGCVRGRRGRARARRAGPRGFVACARARAAGDTRAGLRPRRDPRPARGRRRGPAAGPGAIAPRLRLRPLPRERPVPRGDGGQVGRGDGLLRLRGAPRGRARDGRALRRHRRAHARDRYVPSFERGGGPSPEKNDLP